MDGIDGIDVLVVGFMRIVYFCFLKYVFTLAFNNNSYYG